jgi:hypothetical protein
MILSQEEIKQIGEWIDKEVKSGAMEDNTYTCKLLYDTIASKDTQIEKLQTALYNLIEALNEQTTNGKPSRYCVRVKLKMNEAHAALQAIE